MSTSPFRGDDINKVERLCIFRMSSFIDSRMIVITVAFSSLKYPRKAKNYSNQQAGNKEKSVPDSIRGVVSEGNGHIFILTFK